MHKTIKHELGYYSIEDLPSKEELQEYYSNKYYQTDCKSHKHKYSDDELIFFENQAKVAKHICKYNGENAIHSLLDVGTGEGFFASYFFNQQWNITTLDYSAYGISVHNPEIKDTMIQGDIFKSIEDLILQKNRYDLINLSNVLEHVIDPISLLSNLRKLLDDESYLRISVPNDYSNFQQFLLDKNYTTNTWLCFPDHLHYFTFESLQNLLLSLNYDIEMSIGDFPIEIFLSNETSNYTKNKKNGTHAHKSRVEVDNFLFTQGIEKYLSFYQSLADIGLSRQVVIYAKKQRLIK